MILEPHDSITDPQPVTANLSGKTIIWRRLDLPGHESARMFLTTSRRILMGTAVFLHDREPCRLNYVVKCDKKWNAVSATIDGWVGRNTIEIEIAVGVDHTWRLNKRRCDAVRGCIDLDLNFSPLTNTLPIRRLNLEVGQTARVRAAWLKFPSFELAPLAQVYSRVSNWKYRYESPGFTTELEVDEAGFVIHYPDLWRIENA